MLLVHRRDIVEPVEVRNGLKIGLVFDQFFRTAMKKTNVRIDARDDFAVEIQYQPQYPVGCGMLRPEVERYLRLVAAAGFDIRCGAHGFLPGLPLAALWPSGMMWGAPSQGDMKSKSRNSCTSWTGWYTTRFNSSS